MSEQSGTSSSSDASVSGLLYGLLRSLGVLLRAHMQHAQQEACSDVGRVVGALVLLLAAGLFASLAVLLGEFAAVWAVRHYGGLDWPRSLLIVGGADLLVALVLLLWGRARMRRPILKQTRELLRQTVTTLTDS